MGRGRAFGNLTYVIRYQEELKLKKGLLYLLLLTLFSLPVHAFAASDLEPPRTTISIIGNQGSNGIYYDQVTVEFSAYDSGTGISLTQYRMNNGTWITYQSPIILKESKAYQIDYRSLDKNNNVEGIQSSRFSLKKDTTSPTSTARINGTEGQNNYLIGTVTIELSAVDYQSGIKHIEYSLDLGKTWSIYTSPVALNDPNQNLLYYRAVDKSGNIEKVKKMKANFDNIPPLPPGILLDPFEWTKENVTVTLEHGVDAQSGIKLSQYRLSKDGNWIDYHVPFEISTPGQSIYARSIDNAGNISDIVETQVMIDRTIPEEPEIVIELGDVWYAEEIPVYIKGGSDQESQLRRLEYKIGAEGDWQYYFDPFVIEEEGIYDIYARSMDWAENYSKVVHKQAKYDGTAPTPPTTFKVDNLTFKQFDLSWSGEYDKLGVVGYDVYVDGKKVSSQTKSTYSLRNLKPNTAYKFQISAYDAAGNYSKLSSPYEVETLTDPVFINGDTKLYLGMDGLIVAWGFNNWGTFGNGTRESSDTPQQALISDVVDMKMLPNYSVVVKKKDNTLWGWGDGFGDKPVKLTGMDDVRDYSTTRGLVAIKTDGTVWKLNGPSTDSLTMSSEQIPNLNNITSISTGGSHTLALDKSGDVWAWGRNYLGQLGDGTREDRSVPVKVQTTEKFRKIYANNDISAGITNSGHLYLWGSTAYRTSQLGVPNYWLKPGRAGYVYSSYVLNNIVDIVIDSSPYPSLWALDASGNVFAWGYNQYGQLGLNEITKNPSTLVDFPTKVKIDNVIKIFPANGLLAVKQDGSVWGWGFNRAGQLATGDKLAKIAPVRSMYPTIEKFYFSSARTSDGRFWYYDNNRKNVQLLDMSNPLKADAPDSKLVTDSAYEVTWPEIVGAVSYEIFVNGKFEYVTVKNKYLLEGLKADTLYSIQIRSVNNMTQKSAMSEIHTIQTIKDTIEPTKPSHVIASVIMSDRVEMRWDESTDNFDISKYLVYVNDALVGSTDELEYEINDLNPDTEYIISIKAVDTSNNESELSDPVLVRTKVSDQRMKLLAASSGFTLTIKDDGTVWAWGDNTNGQLGDGSSLTKTTAIQVDNLTNIIAVDAGNGYSMALKEDGTVWTWGRNMNGELGHNDTIMRQSPQQVEGLSEAIDIAAAGSTSFAVTKDGKVWGWGSAYSLLPNYVGATLVPVQIAGIDNAKQIYASEEYVLVVKSDGTVWGWGANQSRILSSLSTSRFSTPIQISSLSNVKKLALGNTHAMALQNDGSVLTWGDNGYGQLGRTGEGSAPQVVPFIKEISDIGAGVRSSFAISVEGTVWVWGANNDGMLGTGKTGNVHSPLQVTSSDDVLAATGSYNHSVILAKDGKLFSTGYNYHGQLGDGTKSTRYIFGQVKLNSAPKVELVYPVGTRAIPAQVNISRPTLQWSQSDDLLTQFTAFQIRVSTESGERLWESSIQEQKTDLNTSSWTITEQLPLNQKLNVQIRVKDSQRWSDWSKASWFKVVSTLPLTKLSARSGGSVFRVKDDGSVWAWGSNHTGQLGDGTTLARPRPVQINGLRDVISIASADNHSLALKKDGTVWAWGNNRFGQLGVDGMNVQLTPQQIPNLTDVAAIEASPASSYAIKKDGTLWSWGNNNQGQLGDGTTISRSTPTQVTLVGTVKALSANESSVLVVKEDGTLWGWGANKNGVLGDGTSYSRTIPGQIPRVTNLTSISMSYTHTLALQENGTVLAWGQSKYSMGSWSPTKVNGIPFAVEVKAGSSQSLVVTKDGSLWSWGENRYGQLGNGRTDTLTTPEKVTYLYEVKEVSAGGDFMVLLKKNETLWSVGYNYNGLGDGGAVVRTEMMQVID